MKKHSGLKKEITDLDVEFGTTKLLTPMKYIPEHFKSGKTKWNKLFNDWFFRGLERLSVKPVEGIDEDMALKCITAHMKSFEPKHEHKEAGIAYMMSQLLDDAEWEVEK